MPHKLWYGGVALEGEYEVCLDRQAVGTVQVLRKGLYYRIICRCRLPGKHICRLMVKDGDTQENLGVPVPVDDSFFLDKMVPVKRFSGEIPTFFLLPKKDTASGTFIPLSPEEPFGYIERLKESYLAERNGITGIIIP